MPEGQRLALEAGIGHEREFVRFWRRLAASAPAWRRRAAPAAAGAGERREPALG